MKRKNKIIVMLVIIILSNISLVSCLVDEVKSVDYLGKFEPMDYEAQGSYDGMTSILLGGYDIELDTALTEYNYLSGGYTWNNIEKPQLITSYGNFSNLRVKLQNAPDNGGGTQSFNFTLYDGASVIGDLYCLISEIDTVATSVGSAAVVPGDEVELSVVPSGTPTVGYVWWSIEFTSDNRNESLLLAGLYTDNNPGSDRYNCLQGGDTYYVNEIDRWQLVPTNGTIKNLYVRTEEDTAGAEKYTNFTVYKNGNPTNLYVNLTNTVVKTGNNIVDEIPVVRGDYVSLRVAVGPTVTAGYTVWGTTFDANVSGESIVMWGDEDDINNITDIEYNHINSRSATWSGTELDTYRLIPSCTVRNLTMLVYDGPDDPNEYWNLTLRLNSTNSSLNCSFGEDQQSKWSNNSVDITYNYTTIDMMVTPFNVDTPADDTSITWGFVIYKPVESEADNTPTITDQNPANESIDVDMYVTLNVTVVDADGDNFNITWQTNASGSWVDFNWNDTCSNGTYSQIATWANTSNTKYWWNVSVNDTNGNWCNESYYFTTATYSWSNWSSWWEFTYTACDEPYNFNASTHNNTVINLTWNHNTTADTCVLVVNESGFTSFPTNVTNGTELYNGTLNSYNHTSLSDDTTYYYSIWGYNITENNYSLSYSYAADTTDANEPPFFGTPDPANNSVGEPLFLNWTIPIYDNQTRFDWTLQCNNSQHNESNYTVNATYSLELYGLVNQTTYTIWVNATDSESSIASIFYFTTGGGEVDAYGEFPVNISTSVSRPPTNLSIHTLGSNLDVYIYFYNETPTTSVWTLLSNWTAGDAGRYESKYLSTINGTTQFIWGNTTYTWSANITDGTNWNNETYTYTTNATISGKNARMDVNNDGSNINVVDLSTDWGQRTVGAYRPYNGLYDVDGDGNVNVVDLSYIWGQRTI